MVRNGALKRIKADDLVPGDIISVAVGDRIPADCRVLSIQSNSFRVDQAILTGESESVGKDTIALKDPRAVKQDQVNMLFSGTTVSTGHATALVVLTGGLTAIGDIQESITSQISEPTPLKQKLNDFGDMLAKVITVICILVWLINIQHFNDPSHGSWAKGAIYYLKVLIMVSDSKFYVLNKSTDCSVPWCRGDSRRLSCRHHDLSCAGDSENGGQERSGPKSAVCGDTWKLQRDLLRQDWNSNDKPDECQ